jgi:hypothetical protein
MAVNTDPTWCCPFCGRIYYAYTQTSCTCPAWTNSQFKNRKTYGDDDGSEGVVIEDPTDEQINAITDRMHNAVESIALEDNLQAREKTLVVNLFAGPGAGKSSIRAGIFHELKRRSIECEEAYEFAKDLVWEKRDYTFEDQIYLFAKQYHRIFRLLGQVDVVITDCPILLTPVYDKEKRASLEQLVVEEHLKMWSYNVFLHRVKSYNPKGRLKTHTEAKAREIDRDVADVLDKHNIPFEVFDGNEEGKDSIVKKILLLLKKPDL